MSLKQKGQKLRPNAENWKFSYTTIYKILNFLYIDKSCNFCIFGFTLHFNVAIWNHFFGAKFSTSLFNRKSKCSCILKVWYDKTMQLPSRIYHILLNLALLYFHVGIEASKKGNSMRNKTKDIRKLPEPTEFILLFSSGLKKGADHRRGFRYKVHP